MGTDYIVNVGPVAIVKNSPRDATDIHRVCCNDQCRLYHHSVPRDTKFCNECGHQISEWHQAVKRPLRVDFYEVLNDKLRLADYADSEKETFILIPNDCTAELEALTKQVGFQRFNLKYGEECQIFPTPEEMHGYVETFKGVFDAELKILKDIFGSDNVTVRYGTVGVIC